MLNAPDRQSEWTMLDRRMVDYAWDLVITHKTNHVTYHYPRFIRQFFPNFNYGKFSASRSTIRKYFCWMINYSRRCIFRIVSLAISVSDYQIERGSREMLVQPSPLMHLFVQITILLQYTTCTREEPECAV